MVGVSSFPVVSRKSRQERGEIHNTDACDVCLPAARFRLTASGPPRVVPAAAHACPYARAPPSLIGHPLIGPTRGSAHVRFVRVGGKSGDRSQCSQLLEISAIVHVLGDRLLRDLRGWLIFEGDRSVILDLI